MLHENVMIVDVKDPSFEVEEGAYELYCRPFGTGRGPRRTESSYYLKSPQKFTN